MEEIVFRQGYGLQQGMLCCRVATRIFTVTCIKTQKTENKLTPIDVVVLQ